MAINNSRQQERVPSVEVDINDLGLAEGLETELDLKEDWQSKSAPPPGRTDVTKPKLYKVRYFIDDEKFEQQTRWGYAANDPNGKYYNKNITCKIQSDDKWQDSLLFYKVSTNVPRGKAISQMAGFLNMIRVKVPEKCTDLYMCKLLIRAFQKLDGPPGIVDADWQGWDSTKPTRMSEFGSTAILMNGKIASSMANFPKNPDGTYQHIAYTKDGVQITAKLKVIKLLPFKKEEDKKEEVVATATGTIGHVNGKAPEPVQQVVQPVAQPIAMVKKPVVVSNLQTDDDGEIILDM